MKDLGFFLGLFAVIVILAVAVGDGRESGSRGTSTSTVTERDTETMDNREEPSYTRPDSSYTPPSTPTPEPEDMLSPREVEEKVAAIYRELDELREDLRAARLREPVSPYSDMVRLSQGSVYSEDPDAEYLRLAAHSSNKEGIAISEWYLESYVTDESADIPEGDRVIERWRSPVEEGIVLLPGETAYLITGDSPIDTSFRENMCTGYLNEEGTFYPNLSRRCPYPKDELERYGNIELDNDRCYEFVERLNTCTAPLDETYSRARVGSACSTFIDNTFNYNDCVRLHQYDPFFSRDGYWFIYLNERSELWRPKREIIRLMDENDRVVSVIEY